MDMGTEVVRSKGWYHGWNIVAVAVFVQIAANGLTVNAFSLFLKEWSADLNAPMSSFQLGLAALGFGSSLLAPFAGILADKVPARRLIAAGLIGLAVFHILVSFVSAAWQYIALSLVFLPISVVLCTSVVLNAVVSRWFVRRLGLALGLSSFGLGMAGVLLPPIIAAVMPDLGWRLIWRGAGLIIIFAILPAAMLIVRDRPRERDGLYYLTDDGKNRFAHRHGGGTESAVGWRDVLKRRNFWLVLIAFLPMLSLYGGFSQNLAPIAVSRGLSQQTAGILMSVFGLAHMTSTLSTGILSDKFGNRLPLFGLTVATAAGGLVAAYGDGLPLLVTAAILVGFSGGLWPLIASAMANEFGRNAVGRSFGLLSMFVPLIAFAPFIVAKTHESSGDYALGLTALVVITLLGGGASLLIRERPRMTTD